MTPVDVGDEHPEVLDTALINAITDTISHLAEPRGKSAALAFLYMYMTSAQGVER